MTPEQFRAKHPEVFLLDANDTDGIVAYLRGQGLLAAGAQATSVAAAGDGNMNCTLRVVTTAGSIILKQARPWVEKYPQLAAPWERIDREAEFYRLIASHPQLAAKMPSVRLFDSTSRILAMEDLGVGRDCSAVYRGDPFTPEEVSDLARFLSDLHSAYSGRANSHSLGNREMRELNHAHIFSIPLAADNGLNLDAITPGLADAAQSLKANPKFRNEVARLGRDVYLADGPCLLHGDFFPGSVYRAADGLKIIDPEFGFFGRPELDVGVFLAHLQLACQPWPVITEWWRSYRPCGAFDRDLTLQLAGVEIMRRLIGYAQLPHLNADLAAKRSLLEAARALVMEPQSNPLHSPTP